MAKLPKLGSLKAPKGVVFQKPKKLSGMKKPKGL